MEPAAWTAGKEIRLFSHCEQGATVYKKVSDIRLGCEAAEGAGALVHHLEAKGIQHMANALETVQGFQQAVGKGDFTAARKLVHDNLSFRGPLETFHQPEPYLESLKKLHHIVERVEMHKVFVDGNDVCLLYDMVTNTSAGTAFIAEWHQVRAGKIASIRVVFDARPFAAMFAK
jgi:SnoaL-like domain